MTKLTAEQRLQTKQLAAKLTLSKKNPNQQYSDEEIRVNEIAQIYEKALGIYRHKPALRYLKGTVKQDNVNFKTWQRAVLFADELGVDFFVYVTAQFYYFDKWFKRHPKVTEIASFKTKTNAKERVKLYLAEVKAAIPVYGSVLPAPTRTAEEDCADSAAQLSILMKNYRKSEEDILRVFGRPDVCETFFSIKWLERNETYKRLREQGEL